MTHRIIIADDEVTLNGRTIIFDALLHSDGAVTISKCASTLRLLHIVDRIHAELGFINTNGIEEVPA